MKSNFSENAEYQAWLTELKSKIQSRQIKAAIAVNSELLQLYWEIGKSIIGRTTYSKTFGHNRKKAIAPSENMENHPILLF